MESPREHKCCRHIRANEMRTQGHQEQQKKTLKQVLSLKVIQMDINGKVEDRESETQNCCSNDSTT